MCIVLELLKKIPDLRQFWVLKSGKYLYYISCSPLSNADRVINHQKRQSVEARCVSECTGNLTFAWTLSLCASEFGDCTELSEQVLSRIMSTEPRQALYYTSRERAYAANKWYLLTFQATWATNKAVYGKTSYRFFVNTAPAEGKICLLMAPFAYT